jgi:acetyl-CoA carboxylase biotin carboxyl carrier protein
MAHSAGRQRIEKSGGAAASKAPRAERAGGETNGVAHHMTDLDFLRGLIQAVDESGIDSLEINRSGTRIRIAKTPNSPMAAPQFASYAAPQALPMPLPLAAPVSAAPAAQQQPQSGSASATAATVTEAPVPASNLVDVTSPMVGTFYRAPAPDAPPYVEPGTHVSKGQTLCILEAMKLMNELECEVDGVVREVLVEDADPVEFGQVLFRVEPASSK